MAIIDLESGEVPSSAPQWTSFGGDSQTAGDLLIYVSESTGNDAWPGTFAQPVKTIAVGKAMLRSGYADHLHLLCGDTFTNETLGDWAGLSGRNTTQRMLVTSYGTGARPLIKTAANVKGLWLLAGADPVNYVAFVGLHFIPNTYSPSSSAPNGIDWRGSSTGLLIEDCWIEKYTNNIYLKADSMKFHAAAAIRYNLVSESNATDAGTTTTTTSDGGYFERCAYLTLIGNIWDTNGWADGTQTGIATSQNVTIHESCTVVNATNETFINCNGIQQFSGGTLKDSLFLHTATAIEFGGGASTSGYHGTCSSNVILDGNNLGPANLTGGIGIKLSNMAGVTVRDNILAGNTSGSAPKAISLDVVQSRSVQNSVFLDNIVYGWRGPIYFAGANSIYTNVQFSGNVVQDLNASTSGLIYEAGTAATPKQVTFTGDTLWAYNLSEYLNCMVDGTGPITFAQWAAKHTATTSTFREVAFSDSTRNIATYMTTFGLGSSLADFRTAVRLQSKQNWSEALTPQTVGGWVRDGYTVTDDVPAVHTMQWTTFEQTAADKTIYVSATGNNGNDGLSTGAPKLTLAGALAALSGRTGFADQILFKCDDTFTDVAGENLLGDFSRSGRSKRQPMVIGSYGTGARPYIKTRGQQFAHINAYVHDLAFVGLHLFPHTRTGSPGGGSPFALYFDHSSANVLIEDCLIEQYNQQIVLLSNGNVGRHVDMAIRGCVIVDGYRYEVPHPSNSINGPLAVYAASFDRLTIEGCVLDRNGWDGITEKSIDDTSRNLYIQEDSTNLVFKNNIVASTDGLMVRPYDTSSVEDNLFLKNYIGLVFGGGNYPPVQGTDGAIVRNCFLDGNDSVYHTRGHGIDMSNVTDVLIERNVIAHNTHGTDPRAILFNTYGGYNPQFSCGPNGCVLEPPGTWTPNTRGVDRARVNNNAIYSWEGPVQFAGTLAQTHDIIIDNLKMYATTSALWLAMHDQSASTKGVSVTNSKFWAPNRIDGTSPTTCWAYIAGYATFATWIGPGPTGLFASTGTAKANPAFLDPSRDISKYMHTLSGTETLRGFLTEARLQSKQNWRIEYTAEAVNRYIREGFGL